MNQTKSLPLLELTSIICAVLLSAALINEAYAETRTTNDKLFDSRFDIGISIDEARAFAQLAGLTGRQSLPPDTGLKLVQGAKLPPCFAATAVSGPLFIQLPYIEDHEWLMLRTALVLVISGTDQIAFVLNGVFE